MSRAVGRVVARGRVRSSVWSRAVGRVVACGRACCHARSGVWSRAVEAPSSVWPREAQSSLEGRARSRVWPLLPGPPCRYRSWGDRRAAMAPADDSAAAADDHTATATTAWSPSRWRALRPAQTRMADILHQWPGAAAMGLAHGMHIGEGSQGRVSRHWQLRPAFAAPHSPAHRSREWAGAERLPLGAASDDLGGSNEGGVGCLMMSLDPGWQQLPGGEMRGCREADHARAGRAFGRARSRPVPYRNSLY